jgi:hypothetical protein
MFSLIALLTACSGCGGHGAPTAALRRSDAAPLIALARRIEHEGGCAQRRDIALLRRRTAELVDARRVPNELQHSLVRGVDTLVADAPLCVPAVPAATTTTAGTTTAPNVRTPPPPSAPPHGHEHHGPHHGPKHPKPEHDHGHGHGQDENQQ